MKTVITTLLLSVSAFSQTLALPKHFTGWGAGYQNQASKQVSGWTNTCTLAWERNYLCLATDSNGANNSTRAGLERVAWAPGRGLFFTVKGDVGASTGANNGAGASYGVGGSVIYSLDRVLKNKPGWFAVASSSWMKSNVQQFVSSDHGKIAFRDFADQAVIRFGFGKGW